MSFACSGIYAQSTPPLTTWQDEIGKGFIPYHQLTAADFPIDDKAHPDASFWVNTFLHYYYHSLSKFTKGGIVYAYVTEWTIFSGLDKNDTSRRSTTGNIKDELPYAQALLDLNEVHARHMAAIPPGEFPSAKGDNLAAARTDLDARVKAFCNDRFKALQLEREAFVKETNRGQNEKKVRELAAAIKKRLDAVAPTGMLSGSRTPNPVPVTSPAAGAH
jgi:hypothetical protein